MQVDKRYPAKLLLFGEHTVLKGSSSLAVPYPAFHMSWVKKEEEHPKWLSEYCAYLYEHCSDFIDVVLLESRIKNHTIVADIPIGYGLGSSGALTAAIYDVAKKSESEEELSDLQEKLGLMESFFHGKSSGFDPLISFLQAPILKREGKLQVLDSSAVSLPVNCYLLDSGSARSGKDMISMFIERYDQFQNRIGELSSINNEVIEDTLHSSSASIFYQNIKTISSIQHDVMSYMIIEELKPLWKHGLLTDDYYIKICGAGGGGYFLVFSLNELQTIGSFKLQKVEL